MPGTYDKGDVVRIKGEFIDNDTSLFVDPTTIIAKTKSPIGVTTSYTFGSSAIVRDALGKYSLKLEPEIQGVWKYRWEGTGINKGAEENSFTIRESEFD